MKSRVIWAVAFASLIVALTTLWFRTRTVNPDEHARIDSALRELRSLDRTINQDVLRARYQLVDSYHPVLQSYRRIEELEGVLADPPAYLEGGAREEWLTAAAAYRSIVTAKQNRIERFKYRSADLKELLSYLPGAGTGVAKAASEAGDERLAQQVNEILQLTLLYNLTSDEKYAPDIAAGLEALAAAGEKTSSPGVRRRVSTLIISIRRLLKVKPEVDRLLVDIFETPVIDQENNVARVYYTGYAAAARTADRYRVVLYALAVVLVLLVGYGMRRLDRSAKALALANDRLEERVTERTRELALRNREMRVVLDNVEQALFTVDLEGHLSRERSAAFDRWFPELGPDTRLWDVVRDLDERAASWIELGWDQLREASMPHDVVLAQLPEALTAGGRHFALAYRPIGEDGGLEKVLLVISDVTERVRRARSEAEQQEFGAIVEQLLQDRAGFLEFFAEGERLIESALGDPDRAAVLRAVHTLKGNAALFGVATLASLCHELESKLVDSGEALDEADRARLLEAWSALDRKTRRFLGTDADSVQLSRNDLDRLERALQVSDPDAALRLLRALEREPAERRLRRIADQARRLAERLGKPVPEVIVEPNGVRLEAARWAPFWASFVHVVRNALEHGIEDDATRQATGKPPAGRIHLRTRASGDHVIVELEDDGRGIDWEAVRARARALGARADSEDELIELLLRGGLSTKKEVTEYSGRGAGVSAAYKACLDLGGTLAVTSVRGRGTTFRFRVPSEQLTVPSVLGV